MGIYNNGKEQLLFKFQHFTANLAQSSSPRSHFMESAPRISCGMRPGAPQQLRCGTLIACLHKRAVLLPNPKVTPSRLWPLRRLFF